MSPLSLLLIVHSITGVMNIRLWEYFKTIPSLSDAVPSNWLLEDHPDVYLYGTLVEASLYLMDDERLPGWSQALEEAVQEIKEADKVARYPSRSKLIMKVR
jgi:hypothetical protein